MAFLRTGIATLSLLLFNQNLARATTAQYTVTFQATWSQATHPTNWPSNAHFSSLIGGTHNSDISFWDVGVLATPGIQLMAERGATQPLRDEVNAAITSGNANSVIGGGGIGLAPGSVSTTFAIDSNYPLVTLVSMIAPSPDWFVGVSGLELFKNGAWRSNVVVDLLPFDAGTDSGSTFTSANLETSPHVPITQITAFPFQNTSPLGTFTFHLDAGITADVNRDGIVNGQDISLVATQWLQTGAPGSLAGDASGDGVVNGQDIALIAANWLTGDATGSGTESVAHAPEPSTLALAALGALALLATHWRRAVG